ncbi:hypothetical protein [Gordonia sp. NPDC003376]
MSSSSAPGGGLTDSTVFVVGGDTAVGRLVALHLVRAGSQRIGIIGSDAAETENTARAVFGAASGMWSVAASGEMSAPAEAQRMVAELSAALGDPDIVVSCSGGPELVSDIAGHTMVELGAGTVIRLDSAASRPGPTGGPEHVRLRTVDGSADRTPEQIAAAVVAAATDTVVPEQN